MLSQLPLEINNYIYAMVLAGSPDARAVSRSAKADVDDTLRILWNRLRIESNGKDPRLGATLFTQMEALEGALGRPTENRDCITLFRELATPFATQGVKLPGCPVTSTQFAQMNHDLNLIKIWPRLVNALILNATDYFSASHLLNLKNRLDPQLKDAVAIRRLIESCKEAGELRGVRELDLSRCELTVVPPELWTFLRLKWLNLSHNNLSLIPSSIETLKHLTHLDVSNNPDLTRLPCALSKCGKLTHLGADYDNLEIPDALFELLKPQLEKWEEERIPHPDSAEAPIETTDTQLVDSQ